MTDKKTIGAYDARASNYADDWMSQPTPQEIHNVAHKHFLRGAPTADIGCGSGRDTDWLCENGYPCTGFDVSQGLLAEASKRFPSRSFLVSSLPELKTIADAAYTNVLCETVLMHLSSVLHLNALENLLRITAPGGVLALSWRHPLAAGVSRENDGRLYEGVDAEKLISQALSVGASVLHHETVTSASSSKTITQLVLRKAL